MAQRLLGGGAQSCYAGYLAPMPDPSTRLNAALEGRYRIERELGQGGMATVYLADDIRHERKVALKVLKPELAAVVGAERFLAEIKTTANLQHPHILPLFDSGEADSFLFYVMPYVEGETLGDRLDREHQLPVADAVQIAKDVAEALAYAHGQGVIHRDIKPANILIHSGRPVISDFGIALAVGVAGGGRLTETGLSLGTPHYMSPEQATGDTHVGPATDIYALGCVLYEMLVGEPPYTGSTAQAVLGKIIQGTPVSATRIRRSVPANLDAAIRKALEKLPADRFRGALDFAKALGDPGFRYGETAAAGSASGARPWNRLTTGMTVAAALFALAFGWLLLRPEPPAPVARFSSPFEEGQAPVVGMAFTSDGSALVYVGPGSSGVETQLWIRRWADLNARPISGTEGAMTFALSPDDREVAFAGLPGPLRIVGIEGGQPRTLVGQVADDPAPNGVLRVFGIAWGSDGMLYFGAQGLIHRVPATGGEPETVTTGRSGLPQALPDGRGLLVMAAGQIAVVGPEGGEPRDLFAGTMATYTTTGHVVYLTAAGTLMAVPFDLKRLEATGPPVALIEDVLASGAGGLQWSLSKTGTLVYTTGVTVRREVVELVWVTRSGDATATVPGYTFVAPQRLPSRPTLKLTPDGNRVAFTAVGADNTDVWVMSLDDPEPPRRLTFRDGFDEQPIWLDGERIAFVSGTAPARVVPRADDQPDFQVWTLRADGVGVAEEVVGGRLLACGVTPDGKTLILYRGTQGAESLGQRDIFTFRPGEDSEPVPLLADSDLQEFSPALSPDGRWLAYVSDKAGRNEVFVVPFPNVRAAQWQVSTDGGMAPVWAHNGAELFYYQPSGRLMMSAEVTTSGSTFGRGRVTPLFTLGDEYPFNPLDPFYDVGPDDQRFLLARTAGLDEAAEERSFILVQNFFEELKRRVPK